MFPGVWTGVALLILRLTAAVRLFVGMSTELSGVPHSWHHALQFVMFSVGVLLLAGLCTPIVGALQAIMQLGVVFSSGNAAIVHVLPAALGVSLVTLGPGAWSADAGLFGRKRIDIRTR